METPNERKARLKALRAAAREEEEEEAAGAPAEAEDAEAPQVCCERQVVAQQVRLALSMLMGVQEAGALTEAQRPDVPRLKFRNYAVRDKKNIEHDAIEAAHPPEQPAAPAPEPVADDADKAGAHVAGSCAPVPHSGCVLSVQPA